MPKKIRPNHSKRVEDKVEMAKNLNSFFKDYLKKIEDENEKLKTDPETVVGQLIPQMRDALGQNKRLSVLAAALLEAQGGSITVPKALLESFESKVLSIKWEMPEGVEDVNDADRFIFSYTVAPIPVDPNQQQTGSTPTESPYLGSIQDSDRTGGIKM